MSYDVYSKFDIEQHKKTFVNYLEVMIAPNGEVHYAVPSHQEFAIRIATEKTGLSREELNDKCPPWHYTSYLEWLLSLTGYVAVLDKECLIGSHCNLTKMQTARLKELKQHGLYKGVIRRWTNY